ncbi:hypothetical protein BU23DRAFT_551669 [Bimuria novae-zelandiae CBS 107.79]|uniref:N-acetyltransferase domain-containing protein n=1 Tax=Bimuria novae-zelandiae CBS 107.79 TaxID=1447943 RepID=A0A6A5VG82_9PLEO|nr:hypothetical protein BU23DRAFT_551669 [Bimuria novae-zelandiae CBS 107.79]
MPTRYVAKEMKTQAEMDAIMDVIWAANYDPYDPYAQLFFPVLGFTPSAREVALAEAKSRFWNSHTSTAASNWYYVQEVTTGEVVGCAQWEIHSENPFKNGAPPMRAPWWPEGEYREFCEEIMRQVYLPRANWMRRPHMVLNWMAVVPSHRRRGVASLLIKIGTSRADELGVECWMEASTMGKPVYEHHGFRAFLKMQFDMERKDANDVWRKCVHELTPTSVSPMWRPKGGIWELGGESVRLPWESGPE